MDEPDPAPTARHREESCGADARIGSRVDGLEPAVDGLDRGDDLLRFDQVPRGIGVGEDTRPERHEFDESNRPVALAGERRECRDLVVVHASDHHHVQLHAVECGGGRLEPALEDLVPAPTRDLPISIGPETVDGHRHPVEPRLAKRFRETMHLKAVGRHRDLGIADASKPTNDLQQFATDRRFATGDLEVPHPDSMGVGRDALELGDRQQRVLRLEGDATIGHAVATAKVAAVGDRDAQHPDRVEGSRTGREARPRGRGLQDVERDVRSGRRHILMVLPRGSGGHHDPDEFRRPRRDA